MFDELTIHITERDLEDYTQPDRTFDENDEFMSCRGCGNREDWCSCWPTDKSRHSRIIETTIDSSDSLRDDEVPY